ncbi:MAG TPA: oligosaccharide flippase family protein, partial [Ruminiclostridium sp.]|nr:oligosaccharide flippase family protein [Ruminiclostridium sp.]
MKKQSTSKNFAVLGTASIVVKILAIVYLPFQTAILHDDGNGIVAKGYNIFIFLFSLSNAGLPNAISKLVAEQAAHKNFKAAQKILKCAYLVLLVLGVAVALAMALGARTIASWIDEPHAYLMLLFLSPTLIFTSVSCALRGYLQGRQNMVPVAISNIIEQILNSVFTVVFAYLLIRYGKDYGAAGTTVGTIIGAIGAAAFLCYVYFTVMGKQRRREIRRTAPELAIPANSEIYKEIARYSLPAILNTFATNAASLIDTFIGTQRLESIGYTAKAANSLFGIYSYQYNRLFTLAIAFSTALVTTMIPAISEALALKNHKLVRHRLSDSYKSIYLITVPSI